jgi:hypothetical protein
VSHSPKLGKLRTILATAAVAVLSLSTALTGSPAVAQQTAIYAPGQPIITGFAGVVPPTNPSAGSDPLDRTFIDLDGSSMVIQQLQPDGPPQGQLIASPPAFVAKAKDVGQVFGIALDNAPDLTGAAAPNIYLTASSAFGLDIVVLDATDGSPVRSKVGAPGATFMPGQWGTAGGATGTPGSIWKVDGVTGEISLFADIPNVGGAGLGDIVFDASTQQFFASDLDDGLVYRLDRNGQVIDSFDHGQSGRPGHSLAPVADDGSVMDITDPAFNAEDPSTWGFTPPERKVYGLAVHGGRLYYAVAAGPQVWSVGINLDGSFANDARWELDVAGLPSANEISNIVFDPQGRMILAQRGPQVGSYDYTVFADPKTSSVVRYTQEIPDDPNTPSIWIETPDTYAIGFRPDGANATGGIALGYGYDPSPRAIGGACSNYLWSTGDSLRDDSELNPPLNPPLDPPAQVHGLQGNDKELVRPENDPPMNSYFTDYDANTGDDQAQDQGHVGDVEIWQKCQGGPGFSMPLPPPGYKMPPGGNLTLYKEATPFDCLDNDASWLCGYTIRVKNTGKTTYWGPISVDDWLPDDNPGAVMHFGPQPWTCTAVGSTEYQCDYPPVILYPGDSVDLNEWVKLPKGDDYCYLDNNASIQWLYGFRDANPNDDYDSASARIRNPDCRPPQGPKTNLKIEKFAHPQTCAQGNGGWDCVFYIKVTNTGPGDYNAPVQVKDMLPFPMTTSAAPSPPWSCVTSGATLTCDHPAQLLHPGQFELLRIVATVPYALARDKQICRIDNSAQITKAPGGTNLNTNPADDTASATATIPSSDCDPASKTDLSLTKTGDGCSAPLRALRLLPANNADFRCVYTVTIKNNGPGTFSGIVHFKDTFGGPVTGILTGPGLICTPVGASYDCASSSAVTLPPGGTISYKLAGLVAAATAGPPQCRLPNMARITSPAGGTAMNTNPANDSGSAVLSIPNPACDQVPPRGGDLSLTKAPSQRCGNILLPANGSIACFMVTITNVGGTPYNGPLHFSDTPGSGVTNLHTSGGATCAPAGSGFDCGLNSNVSLAPGASVNVPVWSAVSNDLGLCRLPNLAHLTQPAGGTLANTVNSNDSGSAVVPVGGPRCGGNTDTSHLRIVKRPGRCSTDGNMDYCTFTVTVSNAGPGAASGPITAKDNPAGGLSPQLQSPNGCTISGDSCTFNGTLAAGASFSFNVLVKAGDRATYDNQCQVQNSASIVAPAGGMSSSATDTVTTGMCGPKVIIVPTKPGTPAGPRCGANTTGLYPNCTCLDGYHHTTRLACVPDKPPIVIRQCGPNSSGVFPRCVCDDGFHNNGRLCVPDKPAGNNDNGNNVPQCPANSHGTSPRCVCDTGFHHQGRLCVADQPAGNNDNGNGDNGNARQCPPGMTGSFPRCTCPDGFHRTSRLTCGRDDVTIAPQSPIGKLPIELNPGVLKALQCPANSSGRFPACACDEGFHHPQGSRACVPEILRINPDLPMKLQDGFSQGPALR